jgi:F-type H+-transporting ATPase subunit delta
MKNQILTKRYTQGLVNSIKSDEEFSALARELSGFAALFQKHKKMREILANPFLPTSKKKQIVEAILAEKPVMRKASRLILLLVENNRVELLSDILESLPEAWNEKNGIYTFEVASVVPLTDDQKKNLEKKLELSEKRPVVLKFKIDPALVGGLWIKRGNMVYDVSIKGSLMKMKEKAYEESV